MVSGDQKLKHVGNGNYDTIHCYNSVKISTDFLLEAVRIVYRPTYNPVTILFRIPGFCVPSWLTTS